MSLEHLSAQPGYSSQNNNFEIVKTEQQALIGKFSKEALLRVTKAGQLSLPNGLSDWDNMQTERHKTRLKFAERYGLEDNATWQEIAYHEKQESRRKISVELGLDETTGWQEIIYTKEKAIKDEQKRLVPKTYYI